MFQTRGLREFFLRYCYESGKAERKEFFLRYCYVIEPTGRFRNEMEKESDKLSERS